MRTTVEQQGLNGLNAAIQTNGWKAPVIPSAWYIDHICPPSQVSAAQAARAFGRSLLTALDGTAPSMLADQGSTLLAKANTLVALAQWLGAVEGYDNVILAGRARSIAIVGLGRLVADLMPRWGRSRPRCRSPCVSRCDRGAGAHPERRGGRRSVRDRGRNDRPGSAALLGRCARRRSRLAQLGPLPSPGSTAMDPQLRALLKPNEGG